MTHKYSLPEPNAVIGGPDDGQTLELARLWWNRDTPEAVVRPAMSDPKMMGNLLAELCWHFADAYARHGGVPQAEAMKALRAGWTEGHARGDAAAATRSGFQ